MRQRSKSCYISSSPADFNDENLASNSLSDNEFAKRWTDEETEEFLEKLRNSIPENDKLAFHTRKDKINWEKIAFKNFSETDCKLHFEELAKGIRRFRYFEEILTDIEVSVRYEANSRQLITPWSLYYKDIKKELKQDHLNKSKSELLNIVQEKFKLLDSKVKSHYRKEANKINLKKDNVISSKTFKSKVKGKSNKTGYHIFLKDMNDEFKSIPLNQRMGVISEKWKAMDSDLKKKFHKRAEIFNEESNNNISIVTIKAIGSTKKLKTKRKPSKSGYNIFITESMQSKEIKKLLPTQRIVQLSKQWRELNPDLKNMYLKRAKKLKEQSLKDTDNEISTECESPKKDKKSGKKSKNKDKADDTSDNTITNISSTSTKRKISYDDDTIYDNDENDHYKSADYENNDSYNTVNYENDNNVDNENDAYGEDNCFNNFEEEEPQRKKKSPKKRKKIKSVSQPSTPPSSVFEYFKSEVHHGNPLKAEAAYEKLNDYKKAEIINSYKELSENYLIQLKEYLQTLSKKEITEFYKLRRDKQ